MIGIDGPDNPSYSVNSVDLGRRLCFHSKRSSISGMESVWA